MVFRGVPTEWDQLVFSRLRERDNFTCEWRISTIGGMHSQCFRFWSLLWTRQKVVTDVCCAVRERVEWCTTVKRWLQLQRSAVPFDAILRPLDWRLVDVTSVWIGRCANFSDLNVTLLIGRQITAGSAPVDVCCHLHVVPKPELNCPVYDKLGNSALALEQHLFM